jgi:hypothetical protein
MDYEIPQIPTWLPENLVKQRQYIMLCFSFSIFLSLKIRKLCNFLLKDDEGKQSKNTGRNRGSNL